MGKFGWFLSGALSLVLIAVVASGAFMLTAHGFSAREQPGFVERWLARRAHVMAIPAGAKEQANPERVSPEVLAEGRAHWADHCAACHANDGSGDTEMGKHMYPPAPDMRQAGTQNLTDGELFYLIQNGVRLTGMPGWGGGSGHDAQDSWKLVHFIRHLPRLSAEELEGMKKLNPKTPDELKEEQEEEEFLNGGTPHEHTHHH